jgi:hypothetical protein
MGVVRDDLAILEQQLPVEFGAWTDPFQVEDDGPLAFDLQGDETNLTPLRIQPVVWIRAVRLKVERKLV